MNHTRIVSAIVLLSFVMCQVVQPVRAWFFLVPLATRLLPYSAGLIARGTTWIAGSVASNAAAWRIGETLATAAGSAIYLSYLMSGEDTSPATTGRIRAQIALKPNQPRDNPDSTKWNDPVTGSVEPTPKLTLASASSFPASSGTTPTNYATINSSMSSGQVKQYTETNSAPRLVYKITDTKTAGQSSAYLSQSYVPIAQGSFTSGQLVWLKAYDVANGSNYDHIYSALVATSASNTRALSTSDLSGCTTGYTYNSTTGACDLTDASAVMKPDMPCEIVEVNGEWKTDSKNPSCIGANVAGFTASGQSASLNFTDGTSTAVTRNTDGGVTITDSNPVKGTSTITTGPRDVTNNGYPLIGYAQTAPGTPGTGTGIGNCGTGSQAPCAVTFDTSGFSGKDAEITTSFNKAVAELDARQTAFSALPSSQSAGDHGVNPSGLFNLGIPQVTCQPLSWPFFGKTLTLNLCPGSPVGDLLAMLRWATGAMFALGAMVYLWRRFTSGAVSSGANN